jgi:hypothetical protein
MVLLDDEAQVEACFGSIGYSVTLTQDMCPVCAERTIGLEIILVTPDGTPRRLRSYRISFRSIWRQCVWRCKMGAQFAPNVP